MSAKGELGAKESVGCKFPVYSNQTPQYARQIGIVNCMKTGIAHGRI